MAILADLGTITEEIAGRIPSRPSGESHPFTSAVGHIRFKQVDGAASHNAGGKILQDPKSSYPLPR